MNIEIIGFRYDNSLDTETLCKIVGQEFAVNPTFKKNVLDIGLAYDSMRDQYNSNILLSLLKKVTKMKDNSDKFIVITDIDLYVPILTYVFGEAELNGNYGVVSSHRLHQEYYGLPKDDYLFQTRIQKEVVHELGHNYGLVHCNNSTCVMHSSTYVEDIDYKESSFCEACKSQFQIV